MDIYEKKLREALNDKSLDFDVVSWIEEQFPELKESEDERIKKALINGFKDYKGWDEEWFDGITVREAIAWLEKQGGQKPVFEMKTPEESLGIDSETYNKIVDECVYDEQKPADNAEPKFKIGDIIRQK